ncbi:serine hydrolase domain-containing protein [Streptomyces sp. NPDC127106]|uniref:serine hydrolase domain-containing protein n=1 Tax=Streptomyces sp. NPDC127106 TaxID=3345360 RepID=UPI003630CE49
MTYSRRAARTVRRTALPAACTALLITGLVLPAAGADPAAPSAVPATTAAATPDPTPSGPVLKTIDPAALRNAVEAETEKMMVPGALVLLTTPQGTFEVGVGTTELDKSRQPTAADHFRIASNTKTMTSALILLLAQDGKLRLSDPVSDYVRDVPNGENITLAQLLKMRSGLYNYTDSPELAASLDAEPAAARTPRQMLDIAFARPPNFPPGTAYEYNNTNYVLLGLVAEKAGGAPLARQLQDRLYTPLGLGRTSFPAIHDTSVPTPYGHGYMYGGTTYALVDQPYPADLREAARSGALKPIDYTHQNPSYAAAPGAVISTADDAATWIRSLTTGKVLGPATQQQWLASPQPEDPAAPDGQKYGYGIAHQRFTPRAAMYYHGGELPGYNSFIGHDPQNGVTLVVWTNLTVSLDGKTTANALLPTILNQVYTGLSLPSPG